MFKSAQTLDLRELPWMVVIEYDGLIFARSRESIVWGQKDITCLTRTTEHRNEVDKIWLSHS